MATPVSSTPQRVCPHCATVSFTAGPRCPACGRGFRRHTLLGVAALLLVTSAIVLGGVALLLVEFGNSLETELDRQVRSVQDGFDDDVRGLQRELREELDRRLPTAPSGP